MVVPTYNEAENLPILARLVLALGEDISMLCVDDASPDGTGDLAQGIADTNPRFHVVHRTGKRGYSAASKEGLLWGLERDYDIVGTMDADLSHDPATLPKLIAAVAEGADLAIGSRYVEGGALHVDWNAFRRAVSEMGSRYARAMVGTETNDCTSGFRCYRASTLRQVAFQGIHSEGYSFLIEMLAALIDHGATVVEVPIVYEDRQAGRSKISRRIIFEALLQTTRVGVSRVLGERHRNREEYLKATRD
ncbi:MAG TPA: polyprenol monophosphomannose synthase [Coriobacteriia bacterium]|nr:polyprenol monophosphomannose synthase [Coriobacteriia bacterium]